MPFILTQLGVQKVLLAWHSGHIHEFKLFQKHLYRGTCWFRKYPHDSKTTNQFSEKKINWFNKNIKQAVCCHEDQTTVWQNFYFLINGIDVRKTAHVHCMKEDQVAIREIISRKEHKWKPQLQGRILTSTLHLFPPCLISLLLTSFKKKFVL